MIIEGVESMRGHTYNGYRLYENPKMIEPDGYDTVERTWRERWFSLPWRPFKETKRVPRYKPMEDVYVVESMMAMFCHPSIANEIRNQCND